MAKTIEPCNGKWAVYRHDTYPPSSVLAGQARRAFVEAFPSISQAKYWHPNAEVLDHSTKVYRGETLEEISGLPSTPPSWFDPADAGESW